jgi:N-acetylmuramoyl-L-alanine amidase
VSERTGNGRVGVRTGCSTWAETTPGNTKIAVKKKARNNALTAQNLGFCEKFATLQGIAITADIASSARNIGLKSLLIAITLLNSSATPKPKPDFKIDVVVIDAGHGGKDPGTVGKRGKEKDITLKVALKLGNYIEKNIPGVKVVYTRKTDKFIELYDRANIANEAKADLFISIHVNAIPNKAAHGGTETYVMGLHKTEGNLEVAKRENSVIMLDENYKEKYEGFDPNSAESYILFSLTQNAYLESSLLFADKVESQFKNRVGRRSHGVKQAGFIVLWKTAMPSVLIETGFITNEREEAFLLSDNGQDLLASGIYRAFKEYKAQIESVN